MKALITGASSGLGKDMAHILSDMGYDLILVSRNFESDEQKEYKTNVKLIKMDLSVNDNCLKLYDEVKNENIDILINNAGFGLYGNFLETSLDKELNMIDLNIKTVHILTKLFLNDFVKKDKGYILNVASSAAFLPGPLMSTYYATKAYVYRLTLSIKEELNRIKSNVYIGCLCPGPVKTNFGFAAGVKFNLKELNSLDVSKYAIKKMFKRKLVIIPSLRIKLGTFFTRLLPIKLLMKISYGIQKKKG